MTGEDATIWVDIHPNELVKVIQSVQGNLIGIIDHMGYVREILDADNNIVQIIQRQNFRAAPLPSNTVHRYGIIFNVRAPSNE